ncbi:Transcriptional activator protein LuxR [Labrenzia sp. THAF35]|nr:Transcriptional activator protein LuxR [Labrenzia sp. THAF35]
MISNIWKTIVYAWTDAVPPSLIEKLPEGISSDSAWTASAQFFESFGFDKLIYIDRTMAGLSMFTTFPESWTSHYRAAAYERIDPFFAYCCTSTTPMGTGIDYLSDYPYLCNAQRQLIQEAGETGMRAGMSCIVRQAGPGGAGGWNLGSSLPRHEIEKIFSEHADLLRLTAFFAHQRLQAALENEHRDIALSPREKECLLWVAQGLRSKQIADKLGLRPVTVELHLKNARTKLRAATREQAIAIALLNGLISP